jgi:hypothetical protein
VARELGLDNVGTDLSIYYLKMAQDRLGLSKLSKWNKGEGIKGENKLDDLPMLKMQNAELP